jgi:hypothetical protein
VLALRPRQPDATSESEVLSHDGSMYGIYGNMDPINISPMLAYIPYMDPMGL